jgi:hypothetical protein
MKLEPLQKREDKDIFTDTIIFGMLISKKENYE